MTKANECTCPSGDGSLRHPCPAHPALVEQAGGDERAAFFKHLIGRHPAHETEIVRVVEHNYAAWKAWQARAALAQPSPTLPPFAEKVLAKLRRFYDCAEDFESGGVDIGRHWLDLLTQLGLLNRVQRSPALWEISQQGEDLLGTPHPSPAPADEKPGDSILCSGCFAKGVGPEHFDEAGKCLVRQQTEPLGAEFAQVLSDNLPELLSTAQAEQAEAERPEVAAWQYRVTAGPQTGWSLWHPGKGEEFERSYTVERRPLMTVAQHERIVGELRAERDGAIKLLGQSVWQKIERLTQERDAALARVAEYEAQAQHSVPGNAAALVRAEAKKYSLNAAGMLDSGAPEHAQTFAIVQLLSEFDDEEAESHWEAIMAYSDFRTSDALFRAAELLAAAPGKEVPQAWLDVQAERRRQITAEGWTPEHDDLYCAAELPRAAAAYILNGANDEAPAIWPFSAKWWKPRDARANYMRAGALILAEIERLDRAAAAGKEVGHE
ncbi:hypothetical protein R4J99_04245 [Pseudomonas aeruginosa]|uniref:hypothetical protein n=1 Tax=Pseudomonas aeruginosa TaxID=287 RepID=UPI002953413B|nr:hypothetical protein [Pseudomonas aeruginosa]MDV7894742.1 hypothetical protein [Pseudomonas aeruginosa]